jgi:hypothetical protein
MAVRQESPKRRLQQLAVKNKNDTTTAIDLCIDLFDKFGIEVWTGPEISQHTEVLDSYSDSDGCEWIDFGQKRWRDRLKRRQLAVLEGRIA